jgi:ribosomal protein S18 acetylase RimI-like enzyme
MADVLDVAAWTRRPWDSEFFGVAIGQVSTGTASAGDLTAVVEQARLDAVQCLYLLVDAGEPDSIAAAERAGFALTDVRLTLGRDLRAGGESGTGTAARTAARTAAGAAAGIPAGTAAGTAGTPARIRLARTDDILPLKALARVSHRNTRFHRDTRFDPARSDEMYAVWIERSIAGELADAVWVVDVDDAPRGYMTIAAGESGGGGVGNGVAVIGLVAVADEYRGRGYGERLMDAALEWSAARGLARASVVTQGTNPASVRFYERAGFTVSRVELWFHCWTREGIQNSEFRIQN